MSLSYIFGQFPIVNVCRCDLFGHVQIFRSYTFGHVESVKWLFLINITLEDTFYLTILFTSTALHNSVSCFKYGFAFQGLNIKINKTGFRPVKGQCKKWLWNRACENRKLKKKARKRKTRERRKTRKKKKKDRKKERII